MWSNRELENYFARPNILKRFAMTTAIEHNKDTVIFETIMTEVIANNTLPRRLNNLEDTWWFEGKLTDDWLDLIFPEFYDRINLSPIFRKGSYHQLIQLLKKEEISAEIVEKLDKIYAFLK